MDLVAATKRILSLDKNIGSYYDAIKIWEAVPEDCLVRSAWNLLQTTYRAHPQLEQLLNIISINNPLILLSKVLHAYLSLSACHRLPNWNSAWQFPMIFAGPRPLLSSLTIFWTTKSNK